MSSNPKNAQAWLLERHEFYKSWSAVAEELGQKAGGRKFNRGMLSAIARGKKSAPPSILKPLGFPTFAAAPVCQACGVVPLAKRCPTCRQRAREAAFERNSQEYDQWRAVHAGELAAVVEWGEGR